MKRLIAAALAAILLLGSAACAPLSGTAEFTVGVLGIADSLDPQKADCDAEVLAAANCFEGLLRFDDNGAPTLAGAISYTVSADARTYTFLLNREARWHLSAAHEALLKEKAVQEVPDTITADDYLFSVRRMFAEKLSGYEKLFCIAGAKEAAGDRKRISEIAVKKTDDYTLVFTLEKPDSDFLCILASGICVPQNETFVTLFDEEYGTSAQTVLCNGPYAIDSFGPTKELHLRKNPDYTGREPAKNAGVTLFPTGKREALLTRFQNKTYDLYLGTGLSTSGKEYTASPYSTVVWGLTFNRTRPNMQNETLRKALLCALQLSSLTPPSFAPESALYLVGRERLVTLSPLSAFPTQAVTTPFDNEASKKNWKKALSMEKLTALSVRVAVPEELEKAFDSLTGNWEALFGRDISITLIPFSPEDADKVKRAGDYDLAVLPAQTKDNTATSLLNSLGEEYNAGTDPAYEALVNAVSLETNEEKKAGRISEAEQYLATHAVWVPLFKQTRMLYLGEGISGIYCAGAAADRGMILFRNGVKK